MILSKLIFLIPHHANIFAIIAGIFVGAGCGEMVVFVRYRETQDEQQVSVNVVNVVERWAEQAVSEQDFPTHSCIATNRH